MSTDTDLKLQFHDDFNQEYGPPEYFDVIRWTKWQGEARTENERALLTTTPSEDLGLAGIVTRNRYCNPGLAGSNGVEVTLVGFTGREEDSQEAKETGEMRLVQAWGLTLGSTAGLLRHKENERVAQLHFDLIRPNGLFVYLVRGLVADDFEKYPKDAYTPGGPTGLSDVERREVHEQLVNRGGIFVSRPCLQLISRVYQSEPEIEAWLGRSHRWGLHLTDDANTVYWTLDGQEMDRVDIAGYFGSNPESVRDGAYLTVGGAGDGSWTIDDVSIWASP